MEPIKFWIVVVVFIAFTAMSIFAVAVDVLASH